MLKKTINNNFKKLTDNLNSLIENFNSEGTLYIKGSRNTIRLFKLHNQTLNIKSFKKPALLNSFIYRYFRKSKARRSYEYATILLEKGVGTPTPIAYYENQNLISLQESYYVSEHQLYDLTFRELVQQLEYQDHENILRQFTRFTWKMHEAGILFKDHSPGNTLIKKDGANYLFFLVDLNRMKFIQLTFKDRIKNFSRLTPKKEMIEIMSDEYAKLIQQPYEKIFDAMWYETERFQEKYWRKQRFKQKCLGR